MQRPLLEVADILAAHSEAFYATHGRAVSSAQRRVVRDVVRCRTSALGGHVDCCDHCDYERISYNSCRNRHCPKCQATAQAEWFEAREADLLPVEYFHVVFTVPEELAAVALQNKKTMYGILLRASAQTLQQIAADPKHLGARIGFVSVLHTWGQSLMHHPHVHCIVPGGGLSLDEPRRWLSCPAGFFLSVDVLSALFRGKFLAMTRRAFERGELEFHGALADLADQHCFEDLLGRAYDTDWVVYAKRPFGGPQQVLKYLARYTHRIAISNHRLLSLRDGWVRFRYKDYKHGNRQKVMTLGAVEFIRRFLLHVLPKRFVRIRHYGLLANASRRAHLETCRELLGCARDPTESAANDPAPPIDDHDDRCPACRLGHLHRRVFKPGFAPQPREPVAIDSS